MKHHLQLVCNLFQHARYHSNIYPTAEAWCYTEWKKKTQEPRLLRSKDTVTIGASATSKTATSNIVTFQSRQSPEFFNHISFPALSLRTIHPFQPSQTPKRSAISLSLRALREPIILYTTLFRWRYIHNGRLALRVYVTVTNALSIWREGKKRCEHPDGSRNGGDGDAWDVQACNASIPFSLPIPLSFIPPLFTVQQ